MFGGGNAVFFDRSDFAARLWPNRPHVVLALSVADIGRSAAKGRPAPSKIVDLAIAVARRAPMPIQPYLIQSPVPVAASHRRQADRLYVMDKRPDVRSPRARYFLRLLYLPTGRPVKGLLKRRC